MKKVGIVTFHAAHNYGSMLQNYALQQAILKHCDGWSPITINMRSQRQREQYDCFKPFSELKDKRRILFSLLYSPWRKALQTKYQLFESFLDNNLILTDEVPELKDDVFKFDAYISGSDQIWNINAMDFSWNYFLDFVNPETRKIAYATSMGTSPDSLTDKFTAEKEKFTDLINQFDYLSVREAKTASFIQKHVGIFPQVVCDPTMLLDTTDWEALIEEEPLIAGDYIFLYNPYYLKEVYSQAKQLSSKLGIRLIVSNINIRSIIHYPLIHKYLPTGPIEFLNLIKNARFVIGRSFHLAVFSTLLNKPFFAVNASGDSRLNNFLAITDQGITDTNGNIMAAIPTVANMTFDDAMKRIKLLRKSGIDFLINSLK